MVALDGPENGGDTYDEYVYDPARNWRPLGNQQTPTRCMTLEELDASLDRLRADRLSREGVIAHEEYGWERAQKRMERSGSYRELKRALRVLSNRNHRLLRAALRAPRWPVVERVELPPAENLAVRFLAGEMRGEIRVPPWLEELALEERRRSVQELAAQGLSATKIAMILGIRRKKVQALLEPLAA